jgi:predicted component of type VI protein secretion system
VSKQFPYPFPERFRSRLMLHYRTRISGTEVQKKLPFRVLVLGNFTGLDAHAEPKNTQGAPEDREAVTTVPSLAARHIRSFRYGKSGERVDDFMAEILPYMKLPDGLKTILPGRLLSPKLEGSEPRNTKAGEKVKVKLTGQAEFVSTKAENGLCDVHGQVAISAEVDIDPNALPPALEVTLGGGGKARGALTIATKDEPIGVVAGVVRLGKASLALSRSEEKEGVLVATLTPPPLSDGERRARIEGDANSIAARANELSVDAARQETKANKLTVSAVPDAAPDQLKAILTEAEKDITDLCTATKAAVQSYKTAAAKGLEVSAKVDGRADAIAGATDFKDATAKAEGGVRQARVVLSAVDTAGVNARSAVDSAKSVVDAYNAALQDAATQVAGLDGKSSSEKIAALADVARKTAAATGRIPGAKASVEKAKENAASAESTATAGAASFDAEADRSVATASADVPAEAERVLPFDTISSFSPDELVANVPELSRLRVIRVLLLALQSELRNVPDLRDAMRTILREQRTDLEALRSKLFTDYKQLAIELPKTT